MKNNLLFGIGGILIGVIISAIVVKTYIGNQFFFENHSKYGFDETIIEIKTSAEQYGWKVPHVTDLQKSMKKFNHDVESIQIIDLCNPDHAIQILKKNNERIVSPFMPCRVAVYKKSDGKVYVSRLNSIKLSGFMDKSVSPVLGKAAVDIEEILSKVVN